jgi:hypothetical protein
MPTGREGGEGERDGFWNLIGARLARPFRVFLFPTTFSFLQIGFSTNAK